MAKRNQESETTPEMLRQAVATATGGGAQSSGMNTAKAMIDAASQKAIEMADTPKANKKEKPKKSYNITIREHTSDTLNKMVYRLLMKKVTSPRPTPSSVINCLIGLHEDDDMDEFMEKFKNSK